MQMRNCLYVGVLALLAFHPAVSQGVIYDVAVDSSSISGTMGSVDFNFNPGPFITQTASLQILNLSTDGALSGAPALTGDVLGSLPSTLTFDNGTAFNDYFQGFQFGANLAFSLNLSGPALTNPGGATSGSTFAFSMFSDPAGTLPALTTDTTDGFAFTVNVGVDGTTTVTNYSQATAVTTPAAAPEIDPETSVAAMTLLIGWLSVMRGRRRNDQSR